MKVGCSPLTGIIYAGKSKVSNGFESWIKKEDVTDTAVSALAEHLIFKDESFMFTIGNKNYIMLVREVKQENKGTFNGIEPLTDSTHS